MYIIYALFPLNSSPPNAGSIRNPAGALAPPPSAAAPAATAAAAPQPLALNPNIGGALFSACGSIDKCHHDIKWTGMAMSFHTFISLLPMIMRPGKS